MSSSCGPWCRILLSSTSFRGRRGSVWSFQMSNVSLRGIPALPWVSEFTELNVRTYVRMADRPGVYFFSLDASNRLAVKTAGTMLNLPYFSASMKVDSPGP